MLEVGTIFKCGQVLCPGCQKYELSSEISECGLWMLSEGDPEPDNAKWDKLDVACGIQTRRIVQTAMAFDEYSFTYPNLYIDWVPKWTLEDAERSGATIEIDHPYCIVLRWSLPSPCGILPLGGRLKYRIAIDDTVTWRQLRKEARDYCRGRDKPVPKGNDLLSRMKNTARHRHTNYEEILDFLKSRGGLQQRGVDAIRLAFNEEIEKVYPPLKGF